MRICPIPGVKEAKENAMAPDTNTIVRAEAIDWYVRLRADRTEDWEAFVAWLARDPAHSSAYDAVALADLDLAPVLTAWASQPLAANDDDRGRSWRAGRRGWLGGAAAAAALLIGVFAGPSLFSDSRYQVATAPGQQRVVDLGGGDRMVLNGGARVTLDKKQTRFAALDEGEATFIIRHDPRSPFTLELGADRVQDVGTLFNVVRDKAGQTIEVAEGAVLYNPGREAITLVAGQTLSDRTGESRIIISRKEPSAIGAWRRGQLIYRGVPLAVVAADLSRNLGTTINVTQSVAARPFSGTIQIDRNQERMFARLAAILDVEAERTGKGWIIGPRGRAAR